MTSNDPATPASSGLGAPAEAHTYTVEQLAGLLQCSERHVWRLTDQNKIPGKIRLGRLVRFARPQVDAWLSGQSPKPSRA